MLNLPMSRASIKHDLSGQRFGRLVARGYLPGGRWEWAVNDEEAGYMKDDTLNNLIADNEYRVTHWAALEWPE